MLTVLLAAVLGIQAFPQETLLSPAGVVERQNAAYNRRDIEAYASLFAMDARVFNFPSEPALSGRDQIRRAFAAQFERAPGGNLVVLNRMVQGSYVFIHGRVAGVAPEPITGVAIYEVREGRIQNVWLVQEQGGPVIP